MNIPNAEQERRLRVAISDAVQDSMGMMMLDEAVLEDMVDAIIDSIVTLVYAS
jgi:hypothetical protein